MELVRIEQEIRTNLTITDKQGLTVKLNELGPPLNTKDLDKVAEKVASKLDKATWFMICGSVPPGVPPHFYNHLIELAHKKKVKTLLDTDGDALLHGLEAQPTVVTSESAGSRAPPKSRADHTHTPGGRSRAHSRNGRSLRGRCPSAVAEPSARSGKDLVEVIPPRIEAVVPDRRRRRARLRLHLGDG